MIRGTAIPSAANERKSSYPVWLRDFRSAGSRTANRKPYARNKSSAMPAYRFFRSTPLHSAPQYQCRTGAKQKRKNRHAHEKNAKRISNSAAQAAPNAKRAGARHLRKCPKNNAPPRRVCEAARRFIQREKLCSSKQRAGERRGKNGQNRSFFPTNAPIIAINLSRRIPASTPELEINGAAPKGTAPTAAPARTAATTNATKLQFRIAVDTTPGMMCEARSLTERQLKAIPSTSRAKSLLGSSLVSAS